MCSTLRKKSITEKRTFDPYLKKSANKFSWLKKPENKFSAKNHKKMI